MDSILILIIAIVSVIIGYAAGALITTSRSEKKGGKETPAVKSSGPALAVPRPSSPANPNRVEVATLWREQSNGALRVDMSGKTIQKTTSLTPDQRSLLGTAITDLQNWLGIAPAPVPMTEVAPIAAVEAMAPIDTAVSARLASVASDNGQPILASRPEINTNLSAQERTSSEIPSQPAPVTDEKKAPTSIVSQIDDILQTQIKGTPLEARGIRLTESATHGVTVWIGIKAYQGMDTIPDEAVNTAIRAAVKEWESRK